MKLLKILFVLILIFPPFGELLRFDVGNNIVIKPIDVVVGITALVWILFNVIPAKAGIHGFRIPPIRRAGKSGMKMKKLILPLLFFVCFCLFSLLINLYWLSFNEFFVGFLYLLRWVAYALLFFIVISFDEKFKNVIKKLLLIDGLLIVVAGFVQYFFYNNLRNLYYLGWDDHLYRLFSTFLDPNFAGSFFVLYFLFVGGIVYQRVQQKNYQWFLFLIGILLLTIIALLLTFSRSALLMFVVSMIVALIFLNKKKFIFLIVGCLVLFFLIISPWFYLENINPLRTASSEARIETAQNALQIIRDHPLFGIGFNAYRYAQIHYGFRETSVPLPSHADAGVDNSFLFVLATTGAVGFIVYCLLLIALVRRAYSLRKQRNILSTVIIASFAGLIVNALFINSLFFAPILLWMWIMLGLEE